VIGNDRPTALRPDAKWEVLMPRTLLVLVVLPFCQALAQEAPPPSAAQEILVPVSARESLRVTIAGVGETVVLVPGLFGSAFGYRHLLRMLPAAGFRAVVIEPLGIGGSPRPRKADYSLTAQADRFAAVLDQIGGQPAVVVAHSIGVSMALRLVYRHPGQVRAVVALDGGPAEEAATPGLRRAMRYAPWVKWLGGIKRIRPKMRKDLVAASGNASWVTDEVMDGYTAPAAADLEGTLLAFLAMAEAREPDRLAGHLAEIHCPVRLVLGDAPHQGGVEQKEVRLLRARLPDFAVDTIPGAGQYLFEEQPKSVLAIIQRVAATNPAVLGSTR
jgi:pimeloyl-ACP methyl ester carboxylesterase